MKDDPILNFQFFIPKRIVRNAQPLSSDVIAPQDYVSVLSDKASSVLEKKLNRFIKGFIGSGIIIIITKMILVTKSWDEMWSWISQFLALIFGESGFNPSAVNSTTVMYEGRKVNSYARGLLQHTGANWRINIARFNKEYPDCDRLLAKTFPGTAAFRNDLLNPPLNPRDVVTDVAQIKPLIGQLLLLRTYISTNFRFSGNGWEPSDTSIGQKIQSSKNWHQFKSANKTILDNKLDGRMALICLISANGSGFYSTEKLYHTDTIKKYISYFRHIFASASASTIARNIATHGIQTGDPVTNYTISSGFGYRLSPYPGFHNGIDIPKPKGTYIYAPFSGKVISVVNSKDAPGGYTIRVVRDSGEYIGLAHLDEAPILKVGERFNAGDILGKVGNTGTVSTGPHLHLSFKKSRYGPFLDPTLYISHLLPLLWEPRIMTKLSRKEGDRA